jgi:3-oxoacyl-[acyl-carrier protein] reductase
LDEAQKQAILGQVALKRYGKGTDIAAAAAYLASDDGAYMTGQVLVVDGGMVI